MDRVLVVGAGIGGLAAATALARRGLEVDVAEREPALNVYGVGINQPGNALRALDRLGVLDEVLAAGYAFDGWDFHDAAGGLVVGVDNRLGDERVPHNNGISRRALHEILAAAAERAGARTRYATTVQTVEEDEAGARVTLTDGSAERYDLIVAFDGIRSAQRRRLFGDRHAPVYSGVAIWRVTRPRPDALTRAVVYQGVGAKAGLCPISRESMYLFAVTPEPAGERLAHEALPRVLRDRLTQFGGDIGDARDAITDGDEVVYTLLNEVTVGSTWHRGRTVVCGDAAHACAPHLTQGAAMALEDAVVLDDELARGSSLPAALVAFTARRLPRTTLVQDASRAILDQEMAVTAETLPVALEGMRTGVPAGLAHVDGVLAEPA